MNKSAGGDGGRYHPKKIAIFYKTSQLSHFLAHNASCLSLIYVFRLFSFVFLFSCSLFLFQGRIMIKDCWTSRRPLNHSFLTNIFFQTLSESPIYFQLGTLKFSIQSSLLPSLESISTSLCCDNPDWPQNDPRIPFSPFHNPKLQGDL